MIDERGEVRGVRGQVAFRFDECACLLDELGEIQRRFGLFAASQKSLTMPGASGLAAIKGIMSAFRAQAPERIGDLEVQAVRDLKAGLRTPSRGGAAEKLSLPSSDVLVYELAGDARIVLRPSGTEPKIKFYFERKEPVAAGEPIATARARAEAALAALQADFLRLVDAVKPT